MSEMIVQVRNKILRRIGGVNHFVSHNKDYTIQFQFDESWNNVRTKMAVFAYEDGEYGSEIFDGDTCNVPEFPREGRILIGVKAGEDLSTELLCIPVCKSADDVITDEYDEPDPKIYEQILDIINNLWNGGTTVYPSPVKFLASPSAAKVRDLIRVKEVDENGDVTRTEGFDVGVELEKKINAPQVAQVGEALTVEEVDADGKPKKWKTAPGVNITTELTQESTDTQVPSAKAAYDAIQNATDKDAVKFVEQELTEDQKQQARDNIGAKPVDFPVIITPSTTDGVTTYTADKTFAEIKAAYDSGANVCVNLYGNLLFLSEISEDHVGFGGIITDYCNVVIINSENIITASDYYLYALKYFNDIIIDDDGNLFVTKDYSFTTMTVPVPNLDVKDGAALKCMASGLEWVEDTSLPAPTTAQVGQIVKVKSVDEDGKITETETVDMPNRLDVTVSMGDNGWVVSHKFAEIKAAYDAGRAVQLIDTDTFRKYSLMGFFPGNIEGVTYADFRFIDSGGDIWQAEINSNDKIEFVKGSTFVTLYGDVPQNTPKAITYSTAIGIGYADFIPYIEIPSTGDELKERLAIIPEYFYVMPNAYAPFVLKNLVNPYTLTRLSYSEPEFGTENNTFEASYLVTDSFGQQIKATCQVLLTESGLGDLVWNFEVRDSLIVKSSTEGSAKKFKITVDDSGTISATEITD